ncbi:hypothetical protein EPA93_48000 [Ktedonosporobacter rubrisoli]|uniref:Uncharacterized protein n=1 Tax=Ktedonosporobacter rubrisoli TaxID=2509675 RepID=A0A4P6K4N9_KTERU|nr:hypothetical protein [Ktedonosporobacter rubrisoli]QBD83298.1 hypothetical protein EPA93_48000 [Ktedonosporobacter rubrisoli]
MSTINSLVRNHSWSQILSKHFSWVFLGACYWLILGITLDTWAHRHIKLETFFTPWHGVLYSGLLAAALALPGVILMNRWRGLSWKEALPTGYDMAILGLIGSFIGGIGDMFWHIFFGVEQLIDAQFSPTHMPLCFFLALLL